MSGAKPPTKPKAQREKEREKEKEKEKNDKQVPVLAPAERLKAVIRRLPPNLPEDVFWASVQSWATDEHVSWKAFYPGKFRKRLNKENIPSRAYIAFTTEEQLAEFSREYDGHLFRDKSGNESQAVVEFAPYQKIPTEKKKADARNATIEKDEDYISFLESLAASNPDPPSLESLILAAQPPAPPKTTPLLEALKAEKTAQKDKEAILRNHAHYSKDPPSNPNLPAAGSKKEDSSKKKSSVPPAPAPKPLPGNTKAIRAGRRLLQQQQQQQQQHKPIIPPQANQPSTEPSNPASGAHTTTSSTSTSTPARKARPLIGLASRQFEAALSGAGVAVTPPVAGSAAGASERKSRREREREREKEREKAAAAGSPPEASRAGVGVGEKPGGGGGTAGSSSGVDQVRVPSIMQRSQPVSVSTPPTILQRSHEQQQQPKAQGPTRVGGDSGEGAGVQGDGSGRGGARRARGGRRGGGGGGARHRGG